MLQNQHLNESSENSKLESDQEKEYSFTKNSASVPAESDFPIIIDAEFRASGSGDMDKIISYNDLYVGKVREMKFKFIPMRDIRLSPSFHPKIVVQESLLIFCLFLQKFL